ncbi:hypothetical protein [Chromohalobacter israelensis]|uniref:hypothetical protein n=1 Tax=Chromohalobacter israelensis TaxID=141390 RepID=UPI00265C102F|nr:hypothetical protein [Chromohalobacter salexigens]MDO0945949.1 hypothetical protein [Chromohalobacter salexigens]
MSTAHHVTDQGPFLPSFRFVEYNPRRAARGAEAVRVEVDYGHGDIDFLWMSPQDIRKNMMAYGRQDGLIKSLEAYGQGGEG